MAAVRLAELECRTVVLLQQQYVRCRHNNAAFVLFVFLRVSVRREGNGGRRRSRGV